MNLVRYVDEPDMNLEKAKQRFERICERCGKLMELDKIGFGGSALASGVDDVRNVMQLVPYEIMAYKIYYCSKCKKSKTISVKIPVGMSQEKWVREEINYLSLRLKK